MPWQNEESGDNSSQPKGESRNPWGAPQGSGQGGNRESENASGPRNPWGSPPPRGGGQEGGPRRPTGPADFDDFIRRTQERLRGGNGGNGGNGHNGGGRGGFSGSSPNIPWGWIVGGIALVLLATSSAYQVGAGERAVITRLGKYSATMGPGFHLKLPAPIDEVTLVKFEDIRTDLIGSTDGENENLMITGDGNVISIAYAVRWRIKSAEDFLLQVADPSTTVRDATESAMREIVGRSTLNNAIGPERAAIAEQVRERVQEILDSYNVGVLVQGVDINRADPPAAVDEAFKDVSAAQQDAERLLNQARAYAQQVNAQAAGATAAFDKVFEEYRLAPEVTRKRMYLETMENVLSKVETTVIEAPGVQTYLPLNEVQRRSTAVAANTAAAEAATKPEPAQ